MPVDIWRRTIFTVGLCVFIWILAACSDDGEDAMPDGDTENTDGDLDTMDADPDPPDGDAEAEAQTFPPEDQTPLFERGLILPENSLECVPVTTGIAQTDCNHHGSTVAVAADGTIWAVWYHGEFEKSLDSRLVVSKLSPGAEEWTWPELLYDDPEHSEGNPAVWIHENGTIYVFFSTITGDGWDQAEVRMVKSENGGGSWSEMVTLQPDWCWNARHRPLRLENGDLLLPCYQECLANPVFIRSSDDFRTWSLEAHEDGEFFIAHASQIQPALILLDGGRVQALTRDGSHSRRIKRMISDDHGRTWTPSEEIGLPNAGTSVDQVRLLDGHVVVVFNNDPYSRFPLTVALSRDGGETFVAMRDLAADCPEGESCSYHYPSIAQSPVDGTLWVTYTHKRRTIGWMRFNEAWLLEGTETAVITCVPGKNCEDGRCFASCASDAGCEGDALCKEGTCRRSCTSDGDCGGGSCAQSGYCVPDVPEGRVDVFCVPREESR